MVKRPSPGVFFHWGVYTRVASNANLRRPFLNIFSTPSQQEKVTKVLRDLVQKSNEKLYSYFKYDHLPEDAQEVSKPFCELAAEVYNTRPWHPQTTVSLQKLLEAKDAAVRAVVN